MSHIKTTKEAEELYDFPQYTYKPFDKVLEQKQIRLLTLFPAGEEKHGPIECNLAIVALDEDTEYEALSYCWGDAKDRKPLKIKQHESCFKAQVNRNLDAALRHLRLPDKPRILWIDALCINQEDVFKRNQQVAMMRDIYRCAAHTVIWLGEATTESEMALDLVAKINVAARIGEELAVRSDIMSRDPAGRIGLPLFIEPVWSYLCNFFSRDWFYRVWIIQELVLSKDTTVLCGKRLLPWDDLHAACQYALKYRLCKDIQGLNADTLTQCGTLNFQRAEMQQEEPCQILYVLQRHTLARATDPRDYIFAFNGLFKRGSSDDLVTRPDYRLDCAEVYTKFAIDLLQQHQSLDVLSILDTKKGSSLGKLPSWVPDWSNKEVSHASCLLRDLHNPKVPIHSRPNYEASGDSVFQMQTDESGLKLLLTGYAVDIVRDVSNVIELNTELQRSNEMFRMVFIMIQNYIEHARMMRSAHNVVFHSPMKKYPTGEERFDVFWQTLCAGNAQADFATSRTAFQALYRRYRFILPLQVLHLDRVWFIASVLVVWSILMTLCCCGLDRWRRRITASQTTSMQFGLDMAESTHRRIMRTRAGLIGLVPRTAQKGDLITLCNGGKLPILLRPQGDGFQLVGDSYVHGLTDGSIWRMLEGTAERSGKMWDAIRPDAQRKEFWIS